MNNEESTPSTQSNANGNHPSQYVVVIRAGSRLRFSPRENLQINAIIASRHVTFTFQTRYIEDNFEAAVPREIWIEARGQAESLNEAVEFFTNFANSILSVISFCANGYAGECIFHLAYDNTPQKNEREFFEQFVSDEKGLPLPSRVIKPNLVLPVLQQVASNPFFNRVTQAIVQYTLALEHWKRGSEVLCIAHLFMGMETLVYVIRSLEMSRLSCSSSEELALSLGIPLKELDSTLRRTILFQGDNDTHKQAKRASDGIEHGFLSFTEIRPLAQVVRDKTARYLREALIKLLELPQDIATALLMRPYDEPIGTIGYVRYFRGKLIGNEENLAAEGEEYPIMEWRFDVNAFAVQDEKVTITFSQHITPRIGPNTQLLPMSVEIYGPEGVVSEVTPEDVINAAVSDQPDNARLKRISSLLEQAEKLILDYGHNEYLQITALDSIIFSIYARCRSLFQSITNLIRQGLIEESQFLGNKLFHDMLLLSQLSNQEERSGTILFLLYDNLRRNRRILQTAQRLLPTSDIVEAIAKTSKELQQIRTIAKQMNLAISAKISLPKLNPADIVSSASFEYFVLTELTSGTIPFGIGRTKSISEDTIRIETRATDAELTAKAASFAIEVMILTAQAAGKMFNWSSNLDIDTITSLSQDVLNI